MSEEKSEEKRSVSPPQFSSSVFDGQKATRFWVRTFDLEEEIETVRKVLGEKPERKRAVVPIVAEYQIDEKFKFIYIIQAYIDPLGISDGLGVIYWASPEHEKEAYQKRDGFADKILERLTASRSFDEMIELETKKEE